MLVLAAASLSIVLTVNGQLHHQLVIMGLGPIDLVLYGLLVLVGKHLRALRADFELLEVGLQALDDLTVFLRTHLGQLNTHNIEFLSKQKPKLPALGTLCSLLMKPDVLLEPTWSSLGE